MTVNAISLSFNTEVSVNANAFMDGTRCQTHGSRGRYMSRRSGKSRHRPDAQERNEPTSYQLYSAQNTYGEDMSMKGLVSIC